MTIFRYPLFRAKRNDSSASNRPMPEPRDSDRSHLPIVATWDIEEVGADENKSSTWAPATLPSMSATNNVLRLPSDEMNVRSCVSEKGLSKIVCFPSAMTELMTSAMSPASSTVGSPYFYIHGGVSLSPQ